MCIHKYDYKNEELEFQNEITHKFDYRYEIDNFEDKKNDQEFIRA